MALIHCPECGKEISSTSKKCIHCGYSLNLNSRRHKKRKSIYIFLLIFFVFSIFLIYQKLQEEKLKEVYIENLREVSYTMLDGAVEAEKCGNLIIQVWNNSIFMKSDEKTDIYTKNESGIFFEDFNDALDNLFSDSKFLDDLDQIQKNQSDVLQLMKKLKDAPKGYEEENACLNNYYEEYMNFTNMVMNPIGSLNSFSEEFSNSDKELIRFYDRIKIYIH